MSVDTVRLIPPSLVAKEIEARVHDAWEREGYVTSEGERDPKAMQDAAYRAVCKRIATSKTDKAERAITRGELFAAVFPNAPGADGKGDQLDEYDQAVFAQLERDVWSLMQPKPSGAIQKRLDEEGSSLVLLQATIRRKLDKAQAVYLTDNAALIMEDSVDKEIKAFERKAENLRRHIDMIVGRHPELASRIRAEVGQGLSRAKAELAFAAPDKTLEAESASSK